MAKFEIGDYVETIGGKTGYVTSIQKVQDPTNKRKSLGNFYNLKDVNGKKIPVSRSEDNIRLISKTKTMTKAKTTTAKKAVTKKPAKSRSQYEAQARIVRISNEATKIQQAGGKKTIPAKSVFKVNRADAVKQAAKKVK